MATCSKVLTDKGASHTENDFENHIDFIQQQWTKRTHKNKQVVIVTAGKSGAGKSTLINNFLSLEGDAALEARRGPNSVTTRVEPCDRVINGVQVRLIDMPGLHTADLGDGTDTSENILGDLKGVTEKGVDVVFYCINLLTRLDIVDLKNMDTLTMAFGSNIWEHVILLFTHTDMVVYNGSSPEKLVKEYIEALQNHLVEKKKVDVEIRSIYSFSDDALSEDAEINKFNGIVGIPVSKNPADPPNWRITLLLQVIRKCRKENIPALLKMNCIDWDELKKFAGIVVAGSAGGAAVGTAVGAGIGAIVCGVATSPIGGVGAAGGAAIGACIGTISGTGSAGFTTFVTRLAYVIRSRHKIEKRARSKIKEMLEKEEKIAQEARGENDHA